jgi:hypothetical protein
MRQFPFLKNENPLTYYVCESFHTYIGKYHPNSTNENPFYPICPFPAKQLKQKMNQTLTTILTDLTATMTDCETRPACGDYMRQTRWEMWVKTGQARKLGKVAGQNSFGDLPELARKLHVGKCGKLRFAQKVLILPKMN